MIKIEIDYDFIISVDDTPKLNNGTSGVYVFMDENNHPLYVGIATNMKTRLRSHFVRQSNTRHVSPQFKKVALIFEQEHLKRRLAEAYLINKLEPPFNKNGRGSSFAKEPKIDGELVFDQCKGLTNAGERCRKMGHSNGYCHYHGGDGVSISSLREAYDDNFFKIDKG